MCFELFDLAVFGGGATTAVVWRARSLALWCRTCVTHDVGSHARVGHSYFMVPDLDEEKLGVVWAHHVRPLVEEYCVNQPQRLEGYALEALLAKKRAKG